MKPAPYKSEADLCRDFIAWAKGHGWTAYAETAGWDILLAHTDGRQFGIQAKLHFNATLLRQVLPSDWYCHVGPDHRGILVPKQTPDVRDVCRAVGVTCFYATEWGSEKFAPGLNAAEHDGWNPETRCELPAYVPDVVAGASSPVQLTEWKVKALRVCALMELRGSVTSRDIRAVGIDARRWISPVTGWLRPVDGKPGHYAAGPNLKVVEQHPKVYAEIVAEVKAVEGTREAFGADADGLFVVNRSRK